MRRALDLRVAILLAAVFICGIRAEALWAQEAELEEIWAEDLFEEEIAETQEKIGIVPAASESLPEEMAEIELLQFEVAAEPQVAEELQEIEEESLTELEAPEEAVALAADALIEKEVMRRSERIEVVLGGEGQYWPEELKALKIETVTGNKPPRLSRNNINELRCDARKVIKSGVSTAERIWQPAVKSETVRRLEE